MRALAGRLAPLAGWPADAGLGVLLAAGNVEFRLVGGPPVRGWPAVGLALLALAQTLPVAARRVRPLAALLVCACAALASVPLGEPPAILEFIAILICLSTVASQRPANWSVPAALFIAAATVVVVREAGPIETGFQLALVAFAWSLGSGARARRQLEDAMVRLRGSLERIRREEAMRAAAEERARIAREVHDIVAHSLSVIVVQAGAGRRVAREEPEEAIGALASVEATGREALGEIRRLLGVLRDVGGQGDRAPSASLERLDELLARFRASGLQVEASVNGDLGGLSATVSLAAYRIVQEALTNCLRHASGAVAVVALARLDGELLVEVTNGPAQGVWLAGGAGSGGQGLPGMRERAELYGGELEAGSLPDGGWRVRARLPVGIEP